eukprot:TRINITY_DN13231_c0_g1_i1.p1 TRINITY_DN13231_c0_g1~~TRINITY_DN13231_c0_g1_i1.p1  ORF type:complete len:134 (+),score=19.68 TRINITY_DN13231_c0_g1_i1:20-421(+)
MQEHKKKKNNRKKKQRSKKSSSTSNSNKQITKQPKIENKLQFKHFLELFTVPKRNPVPFTTNLHIWLCFCTLLPSIAATIFCLSLRKKRLKWEEIIHNNEKMSDLKAENKSRKERIYNLMVRGCKIDDISYNT